MNYCKLFDVLVQRKLSPIFYRLLLDMYTSHVTRIMWNGVLSERLLVKNGVKQGGVLSRVLFCIYSDGLLERLARSRTGCTVGAVYIGAQAYADDILVLLPIRLLLYMRLLLQSCDNYAKDYNITFNASKSKCMYIPPYKYRAFRLNQRPVFYISDHSLVYVNEYSHLGHIISPDSDDKSDIIRRNILCGQINNVLCYFGRCCSVFKQRLLFTYTVTTCMVVCSGIKKIHIR